MVRSHLEYAGALWNPYKKGDIKRLEKLQMRTSEHRRSSLLQRIRERLGEQRSKRGRMSSNKNAKRPQRRVELGWLHYDERVQDLCKFALAKVVELGMLLYQRQLDHKTSWLLQNNCSFPAGCPARDILTTLT